MSASAAATARPLAASTLATGLVGVDAWVLTAVATALVIRLVHLAVAPLWLDEVLTAQWVALPAVDTIRTALTDNHPPLYFLLLQIWTSVAGDSPWALRALSALASSAAVVAIAALTARMAGAAAARWAAWMAALSPYLVHHGQEARMYALVTLLAAVQLIALVRFLRRDSARLGAMFVASGWALAATHYYAALFIGGELLALAVARGSARRRAALPAALLTALAPIAAVAVAFLLARHQAGRQYGFGVLAVPGTIWAMLAGYTLLPSSQSLHDQGTWAVLPYLPLALCGGLAMLVSAIHAWRSLAPTMRVAIAVILGTAMAVPLLAQVFAEVGFNPRYLAAGMPLFIVVLAAGAPRQLGWNARSVSTVFIMVVMALGTLLNLAEPGHGREDVAAAGRWLDAHVAPDREVLVTSSEMDLITRYHWPSRRLRLYPPLGVHADHANASALAAGLPFGNADRVYFVVGRAWVSDPTRLLRTALRERYQPCEGARVRGIDILCLRAPGENGGRR